MLAQKEERLFTLLPDFPRGGWKSCDCFCFRSFIWLGLVQELIEIPSSILYLLSGRLLYTSTRIERIDPRPRNFLIFKIERTPVSSDFNSRRTKKHSNEEGRMPIFGTFLKLEWSQQIESSAVSRREIFLHDKCYKCSTKSSLYHP